MPATNGNEATQFETLSIGRKCPGPARPPVRFKEPCHALCAIQEEADYQHHS